MKMKFGRITLRHPPTLAALVSLFASVLSYGQVGYDAATLKGTVFDSSGMAVPDATITITNPSTGIGWQSKSVEHGIYQKKWLTPGSYKVKF